MKKSFGKTHSVVQLLLILWMTSLIHIAVGDYSATYLPEGESHFISFPHTSEIRLYEATLLQTNATNGFQVVLQNLRIYDDDSKVQIGTGNDPSDIRSVITTIRGHTHDALDHVYVDNNEMWFAAIGSGLDHGVGITAIDLLNFFPCLGSIMNVSVTLVCDGYYDCDNYEDESSCNYSATYLPEGESHFISLPDTSEIRLYEATLLQTNASNGFRVVFQNVRLSDDSIVQIGTGNDPSDIQSVITTIHGYTHYAPDHVYVDNNEMWFAAIGPGQDSYFRMGVGIAAIDLLNFFPCLGSIMNVSVTLVCDGYYDCDNYEDESSCNYSATYLQKGGSHFISLPTTTTTRLYIATLLQTNATNGFRVVFQDVPYLENDDNIVQIGIGNDPSDIQSVIITIHGYTRYAPDDVYVYNNEMWIAAIGAKSDSELKMDVEIISIDLSTLLACSGSKMIVLPTLLCDGLYHCDHYEDELACNYSATYLEVGESYFINMYSYERLYNVTLLQTNAMKGFRVFFQDFLLYSDAEVKIGTGNDPSDNQSVITTIHGSVPYAYDVYVDTNEMWFVAKGGKDKSPVVLDVEIISIKLSAFFYCSSSNMSVSPTVLCDGLYQCDHYEDESACDYSSTYLEEGESYFIYKPISTFNSRSYKVTLLQTNAMKGFRVVYQHSSYYFHGKAMLGTGNDPSDSQSVITIFNKDTNYDQDVYVNTNEMWFAVIGTKSTLSRFDIDVEIISIDLSTFFYCSSSNISVSTTVLCDGLYHCDHFEDESACNNLATYLQKGESHFINIPLTRTSRWFNASLVQTSTMYGFRIAFQYMDLSYDDEVQIGTGNDPSDIQSVTTTIHGAIDYAPDDVYVGTNEMWFAVIGGKSYSRLQVEAEIIPFDLSIDCSGSNPCQNGGTCEDNACTCVAGFNGVVCSTVDCSGSNPCRNGGTCKNNACKCAARFNGALCGTVDCSGSNPCRNGGTCENNACTCAAGFDGALCGTVDCSGSNPCRNGGTCKNNACKCPARFNGALCSTVDCSGSNPCRNGGTCKNNACKCPARFNGALCSTVACSRRHPCRNGGTCKKKACKCAAGFNGDLCSTVDCSGSNPCRNGGTCENNACTCAAGFDGALCSTVDCSGSNPCRNGGVCENNACTCAAGFDGALCNQGM
ncbi:uncharacterized protein LOC100888963 isoform X3 [Strongylocentrotus purpuratus]|uniref:EGF-like domain-containing protein n=1 Tax=Strongylocentrotus purpuratus TaxID=7668 RepID=A0A7M7P4J8_STRPU|nr:uncharacterized protein LOC100888963 isoform X3 [Strongylocentrotus purpuratus]